MKRARLAIPVLALMALGGGTAAAWDLGWVDLLGGGGNDIGASVITDASGVYMLGTVTGNLPGQLPAGGRDAFVRKYSPAGAILWTRQFGTPLNEAGEVITLHDGGVYVLGETAGTLPGQTSQGSVDVYVRRYTADGGLVWTKQFGTAGYDNGWGMAVNEHGVFVAGYTFEGVQGPSALHPYLARLETDDGALDWVQSLGQSGVGQPPSPPASVAVDDTGVYAIANVIGTMAFRKFDFDGQEIWSRDIPDVLSCYFYGYGVSAYGGRVSMFGQVDKAFWQDLSSCHHMGVVVGGLRTYDAGGNLLWQRTVEAGPQAGEQPFTGGKFVRVAPDGVYVASNTTTTFAGFAPRTPRPDYSECPGEGDPFFDALDAYVRRYDNDGNVVWTRQFGGGVYDLVQSVAIGHDSVYAAGSTSCSFLDLPYHGGQYDAFLVSFALDPQTAGGKTHLIVGTLETLKDQGRLARPGFDALVRHLTRAAGAIAGGDTPRARLALQTFLRAVTRSHSLGVLSDQEAAGLTSAAQAVLAML